MTRSTPGTLFRIASALALVGSVALLPACEDDPRVDDLQDRIGKLSRQMDDVADENGKLERKLAAAQDRIADLEQGVGELRMQRLASVGEAVEVAEAGAAGSDVRAGAASATDEPVSEEIAKLRRMLQDETARAAIAEALESERRDRRNERDDERLARFAEQAGLSADQAERLGQLLSENRDAMRALFEAGRDADDREATRAAVQEMRAALDESLKALLSDEQFTQFKESRISSPGGRRRGGGGTGNRGGDGGGRNGR